LHAHPDDGNHDESELPMNQTRVLCVAALAVAALGAPSSAQRAEPFRDLDAYVTAGLKLWGVPGLSLAIVRNDSVIYVKGYGRLEANRPELVNEQTIFAVGSTSKAFTTAALAMLVDAKKVSWDDQVTRYLPWFRMHDPFVTQQLTVRDLVTHRSGLSRGDAVWSVYDYGRDEVARRVRFLAPTWGLRSTFGYQNLMYVTAGQVIAHVSGKSWDVFLRERIFAPLGMTSTSTSIDGFKGSRNVASPHARVGDSLLAVAWQNVDDVGAAGSMNSTAPDMAQWIRLHLGKGTFAGQKLISAEQVTEIQTPQMAVRLEGPWYARSPDAHLLSYGLGWFIQDHRGKKLVQHSGNVNQMSAVVGLLPEESFGVVVMTNAAGTLLPNAIMYKILDQQLKAPAKDWSGEMRARAVADADRARAAQQNQPPRVSGTRPSLSLDRYAGVYADSLYGQLSVRHENGRLLLAFGTRPETELEHWHYDTFRAQWPALGIRPHSVTFAIDARASIPSLTIDAEGDIVFRRDTAGTMTGQRSGTPPSGKE
jgi:CubicO group peptidase (beta-lactamase class C family)